MVQLSQDGINGDKKNLNMILIHVSYILLPTSRCPSDIYFIIYIRHFNLILLTKSFHFFEIYHINYQITYQTLNH